jgi:protein O-GlcNAc transferase
VAGSLLRAVGLDELITTSLEEYEALALRLAGDSKLLGRLRARIAENRLTFPLFDTERSTRALEAAYQQMCEIRRGGQAPTAFSILASDAQIADTGFYGHAPELAAPEAGSK